LSPQTSFRAFFSATTSFIVSSRVRLSPHRFAAGQGL
jgi:hypothetical protein